MAMEKDPVISAIVPVYKSEKTLPRTLDSLLRQKVGVPFEIIISLSGKNLDGSYDVAKRYEESHPDIIRLFAREERMALGLARAEGIPHARGKYLYFIDADDELREDGFAVLLKTMEETGADMVNCGLYEVHGKEGSAETKVWRYPFHTRRTMNKKQAYRAFFTDFSFRGFVWNKMFKRELFFNNRPLLHLTEPEDMFEDGPFILSLISLCEKVVSIPDPLYYYYMNVPGQITRAPRLDRASRHLATYALERHFLEMRQEKDGLNAFFRKRWRTKGSLHFDYRIDKKNGASKEEIKKVKKLAKTVLSKKKPLPLEGVGYAALLKRSYKG